MDTFLSSLRPRLEAEPNTRVLVVTGNESADLDSIVCALTTSFFLSRLQQFILDRSDAIVIPFINIDQEDLALRSDVEYVLHSSNIQANNIFFRDHLPMLEAILQRNPEQLSLFLVDHNKLPGNMDSLKAAKVIGVIDHHVDEGLYHDTAKIRRIELVGSCASLVVDEFMKKAIAESQHKNQRDNDKEGQAPSWIPQIARLLLSPILIDTRALNPDFKKVTPMDVEAVNQITPYADSNSLDDIYNAIDAARRATSQLSFYDLLRKDYKEWTVSKHGTGEDVKVGISSVIGLIDKYVRRDGKEIIHQAIDKWALRRNLDLSMVLLGDDLGPDHGGYKRQVIVNPRTKLVEGFAAQLESVPELQLERTPLLDEDEFLKKGGGAYAQHNTSYSRKQIWPVVETMLTSQPSTTANL